MLYRLVAHLPFWIKFTVRPNQANCMSIEDFASLLLVTLHHYRNGGKPGSGPGNAWHKKTTADNWKSGINDSFKKNSQYQCFQKHPLKRYIYTFNVSRKLHTFVSFIRCETEMCTCIEYLWYFQYQPLYNVQWYMMYVTPSKLLFLATPGDSLSTGSRRSVSPTIPTEVDFHTPATFTFIMITGTGYRIGW